MVTIVVPSTFYNQNLVLLYKQFQSTIINHMDIKKVVDLKTRLIFQQLFELVFYMYNYLCFCLNQLIQAK
jgi:hypothetical protein